MQRGFIARTHQVDKNTHWPCTRPGLMWLIAYSFIGQGCAPLKNNVMKREISTTRVYINQSANELHGAFKWGHGRQLRQVKCWAFFTNGGAHVCVWLFCTPQYGTRKLFLPIKVTQRHRSQWRAARLRVWLVPHKFINLQHADDSQQIWANCDIRYIQLSGLELFRQTEWKKFDFQTKTGSQPPSQVFDKQIQTFAVILNVNVCPWIPQF
jgi:hypothetical protein